MTEEEIRLMREALDRDVLDAARRIFEGPLASGPRPAFEERDFGRWSDKVGGNPASDGGWTHFELPPEFLYGGTPCQAFADHEADAARLWAEAASPSRRSKSSFKETGKDRSKDRPDVFQFPGGEMFTTRRPTPSLFLSTDYLAVSEEPSVAVAAVQFRAARAREALAMAGEGSAAEVARLIGAALDAEEKLRRRVRAAIGVQAAEPGLWA